ncbi:hypothetical protein Rhopal_001100-T1 [Rhodotorula paludigena]|uniref:PX domain-containing protein n=1 Tax=Rhodotorula paludigena TaxID=86838 RepID=A0AAV5GFK8_9BASI|nr:hypothetical protein Rhopal_001100-T1 [Rhodotorula paludigena]
MNDFDPLHPAAYDPSPRPARRPYDGSNLSSVAPRSPLPGYDRDYRAPAAGSPSPGGWNAPRRADDVAGSPSRAPLGGMVPREPRTADAPDAAATRRLAEDLNGTQPQRRAGDAAPARDGFIRIRILGLDRNKRDLYIKFNVEVCSYPHRSVSRSYAEFGNLVSALSVTCPQSIVPALPLQQTSAATDEEDDRLIKSAFQKWVVRLTSDPAVIRDEEMRSFIESDFGYQARARKKSSTPFFSRSSRLPGELDDPLTAAKISMARLETAFNDSAKVVDKVSKTRRTTATSVSELGDQLTTFAMAESFQPLANGLKRLGRTMKVDADLLANQAINEQVALGDVLYYQAANAKSAKDTLSGRDAVVEEHRKAVKSSIEKRRAIEKLRSSSSLKADRVNEALEDLDEAQRYEETLGRRLQGISTNLQPSLTRHSLDTHNDILSALLEHARHTLLYEKQRLKEYETLRPEMRAIRKPDAGVIYRGTPGAAGMGRTASGASASSASGTLRPASPAASPTPSRTFGSSPLAANAPAARPPGAPGAAGDPLTSYSAGPDLSSMAQKGQKRSVRSMASSVHVEGDRRQRVDARMAASMLANGF